MTSTAISADVMHRVSRGEVCVYEDATLHREIDAFTREFLAKRASELFSTKIGGELERLHESLDRAGMALIVKRAHEHRRELMAIPRFIAGALARAGLSGKVLLSYNEHLRLIPPEEPGKVTLGVPPHRDSWYSLPAEAVNVWIPCTIAPGVALYPQFFGRKIAVGHKDPANKHHRVSGIDFASEPITSPPLALGQALLFCGNHLHRSRLNDSLVTRISWDYRMLLLDDVRPSLRLHEFVYADLFLEGEEDPRRLHALTQRRLRRERPSLWAARGLTGGRPKLPFTKLGRALKNAFPGTFYS